MEITPLKDYCEWLEDLTHAGDSINANGLQKYIERYAQEYHENEVKETGGNTVKDLKYMFFTGTISAEELAEFVNKNRVEVVSISAITNAGHVYYTLFYR